MRAHLVYLRYVLRHKWFVAVACMRVGGIPIWRWLTHDWTKFLPSEWGPYVRYFYNPDGTMIQRRDATGHYQSPGDGTPFDYAWLLHQKRNKHHWQFWVLARDDGTVLPLAMPEEYAREMLADWIGAGKAQGIRADGRQPEVTTWYERNQHKMSLHKDTREVVTRLLHA